MQCHKLLAPTMLGAFAALVGVGVGGLATCTPFTGTDASAADAAASGDGTTSPPTEAGADGQISGGNCDTAFFCEPFNDDNLESREWSRTGNGVAVIKGGLRVSLAGGSSSTAFIQRVLATATTTTIKRLRITMSMQIPSGRLGDIDFVSWRDRKTLTGLFITRNDNGYLLASFKEGQPSAIQAPLPHTFDATTRFTFLIDFETRQARFIADGTDTSVGFPDAANLRPANAELVLGISSILKPSSTPYVVLYDDLMIEVE